MTDRPADDDIRPEGDSSAEDQPDGNYPSSDLARETEPDVEDLERLTPARDWSEEEPEPDEY